MAGNILNLTGKYGKQDAVVFRSRSPQSQALVLSTGKLYDVSDRFTKNMYKYCAPTYSSPVKILDEGYEGNVTFTLDGNTLQMCQSECCNQQEHAVCVDNFVYSFHQGTVYRRPYNTHQWSAVSKLPLKMGIESTAVFKNKIILLYQFLDPERENLRRAAQQLLPHRTVPICEKHITEVFSFDTSTFRTQKLDSWDDTASAVTFYCKGNLHILNGRGSSFYVDGTYGYRPMSLRRTCYYDNWYTHIPLCGAVLDQKSNLLLFSKELPHDEDLPHKIRVDDGDNMKVKCLQILTDGNCHHVQLPASWLTKEI